MRNTEQIDLEPPSLFPRTTDCQKEWKQENENKQQQYAAHEFIF